MTRTFKIYGKLQKIKSIWLTGIERISCSWHGKHFQVMVILPSRPCYNLMGETIFFSKIIADFQNLGKEVSIQVKEEFRIPNKYHQRKTSPHYSLNTKHTKQRMCSDWKLQEKQVTYKGNLTGIVANFTKETLTEEKIRDALVRMWTREHLVC